jgi:Methyltransferase FkbM domain
LNVAAGAAPGSSVFFEEPGGGETASLVAGVSRADAIPRTVEVSTVAAAVHEARLEHVDVLKIDAEGADLAVLRGAEPLFAERRVGAVQFEYNWSWAAGGATLGGALSFLERFGLTCFVVRLDRLEPFSYARYGEYFGLTNFVALTDDVRSRHSGQLFG